MGVMSFPLSVVTLPVNGTLRATLMCIEESSVVAAANKAAKMLTLSGGITATGKD